MRPHTFKTHSQIIQQQSQNKATFNSLSCKTHHNTRSLSVQKSTRFARLFQPERLPDVEIANTSECGVLVSAKDHASKYEPDYVFGLPYDCCHS